MLCADSAVVRVMEQQTAVSRGRAMPADTRYELRLIPLVHDHDVGAIERFIQIESGRIVERAAQTRVSRLEGIQRPIPMAFAQIAQTPAANRLEYLDAMPPVHQLGHDAAQEVRIAVVPVGHQRVIEQNEIHAETPT